MNAYEEIAVELLRVKGGFDMVKNLFREPLEVTESVRRNWERVIITQSGRKLINGDIYHIDIEVIDKLINKHIGIEVMYLTDRKSDLSHRVNKLIYNYTLYPENEFLYLLLGDGFNEKSDVMMGFNGLVKEKGINLTITRSIEDFEKHLNNIYMEVSVSS